MRRIVFATALSLLLVGPAWAQSVVTPNPDPNHPILSHTFQTQTDVASGSPLTWGSQLELLEDGVVSFPRKLDLVRTAQSTLLYSNMINAYDQTGRQFLAELIAAHNRGVKVRCLVDGQRTDPRFYWELRDAGVPVVAWNPWLFLFGRSGKLHMKTLVADQRRAITGGLNMADAYNLGDGVNAHYHDNDVYVEGDGAAVIALAVLDLITQLRPNDALARDLLLTLPLWGPTPGAPPAGPVTKGRFLMQVSDLGRYAIRDYYVRCFDVAQRQIVWHANNLQPSGPILSSLKAAASRGVRVALITNSLLANMRHIGGFSGWFQYYYNRLVRRLRLRNSGIEVWELDQPTHSKVMTVDGVLASVGSYNLSSTADKYLEGTFVAYDPGLVAATELMLDRDLQTATRVDY